MVTLNIDRLPFFSYVEPPKGFHRLRNVSGAGLCGVTLRLYVSEEATEAASFIARLLCDETKSMTASEWCFCTPTCVQFTMRHTNRLENLSVLGTISIYKLAARY